MSSLRPFLLLAFVSASFGTAHAMTLTAANVAHTEDFNTLATATGSVLPAGWAFVETGSGANTTYGATNGGSSTGNTYSFGATGDVDRSLGGLRTSSVASAFGAMITNQTGSVITRLDIQYVGEQWRLGALARPDRLDFAYSLDATSLTTGTWIEFDGLDFIGPVTSGTTGALDGNAPENQVQISQSIGSLSLASGSSLWVRWIDFDATGSDDGLAIDNVAITAIPGAAQAVPEHLPLPVVAGVFTGVLVFGSRRSRKGE